VTITDWKGQFRVAYASSKTKKIELYKEFVAAELYMQYQVCTKPY